MRSVDLKVLKNKLSEYVRLAEAGETVLVTDRDRVVAELCPPTVRPSRLAVGPGDRADGPGRLDVPADRSPRRSSAAEARDDLGSSSNQAIARDREDR